MPSSKIISLVGIDGTKANMRLPDGKTQLGRSCKELNCPDKKVSREHAHIEVDREGKVWLTAAHVNPCFIHDEESETPKPLKKGEKLALNDGDKFSLLPNQYIYKVVIKRGSVKEDSKEDESKEDESKDDESKEDESEEEESEEEESEEESEEEDSDDNEDFEPSSDSDWEAERGRRGAKGGKKKRQATSDDDSDEDWGKSKRKKKPASSSKKPRPAPSRRQPSRSAASHKYQESDDEDDDF